MWTINQMEQLSPFGGVLEMSHREEPRSGRGCFGAVVVVPFLALGGMFALIALTGSPDEAPLAAPPPARPTSQWWTEPFETGTTLATVTETVVVEGAAREVRAARLATAGRAATSTVTETVRVSSTKPPATGRNEPPGAGEEEPEPPVVTSTSDSASPVVTTSSVAGPPVLEPPVSTGPAEPTAPSVEVPPSTPRAEDPVPSVPSSPPVSTTPITPTTPVEPPCDRSEPTPSEPSGPSESAESDGEVVVEVGLLIASPAEESSTSSAPLAGV
jgi:hypothetical protein